MPASSAVLPRAWPLFWGGSHTYTLKRLQRMPQGPGRRQRRQRCRQEQPQQHGAGDDKKRKPRRSTHTPTYRYTRAQQQGHAATRRCWLTVHVPARQVPLKVRNACNGAHTPAHWQRLLLRRRLISNGKREIVLVVGRLHGNGERAPGVWDPKSGDGMAEMDAMPVAKVPRTGGSRYLPVIRRHCTRSHIGERKERRTATHGARKCLKQVQCCAAAIQQLGGRGQGALPWIPRGQCQAQGCARAQVQRDPAFTNTATHA